MKRLLTLLLALVTLGATAQTTQPIPTRNQVGADCLPAEIAPIQAPFYMPQLQKPEFKDREVRLTPPAEGE